MPLQLIGLVLTFTTILVLVGRRLPITVCIAAGTLVLAVTSRMPLGDMLPSVARGLIQKETVGLVLGVAAVTSLAGVMRDFGLLDDLVSSVIRLLGGARPAIIAIPSLIGSLPVTGGAVLSAPMVDGLGDQLSLPPVRKAAVNMVFRHAWFYIAPFSPQVVLASGLAGVPIGLFIIRQLPFCVLMLSVGYLVLLWRVPRSAVSASGRAEVVPGPGQPEVAVAGDAAALSIAPAPRAGAAPGIAPAPRAAVAPGRAGPAIQALPQFLRSASPLITGVVLCLGVGPIRLPLYLAVSAGLVVALFLSRRKPGFRLVGLPAVLGNVQWPIVTSMAAVMVFSQFVKDTGTAQALVGWLTGSGLPIWAAMTFLPGALAYVTGVPSIPIGVAFPILIPLFPPALRIQAAAVMFTSGFLLYFMSPLHMCAVLTSQYFKVTIPRLYREYWPVVLVMAALTIVYTCLLVS